MKTEAGGRSPCDPDNDADDDGLLDAEEVAIGTHLLNPDSDDDGFGDAVELDAGSNPNDARSTPDGIEATPVPILPVYFHFVLVGSVVAGGLVMWRRRLV